MEVEPPTAMRRLALATRGWWTVPVLMIALLCTGCSALDSNALSTRSHGYGDADLEALHIRAVRLVTAHDGRSVAVVGTFVNDGPADTLERVTARPGDAGRGPAVVSHPLAIHIGSGDVVQVGGPGRTQIVIADPSKGLAAGFAADVTLSFARAGTTTVGIIVDAPRDYLAPYAPPSTPPSTKPSTKPSTPPPNLAQRA